jgi:hypothetical protein
MSTCKSLHIDVPRSIEELPDSQAKRWRHKCAGCAYEAGWNDAQAQFARAVELASQAQAQAQESGHSSSKAKALLKRFKGLWNNGVV